MLYRDTHSSEAFLSLLLALVKAAHSLGWLFEFGPAARRGS